MMLRKSLLIVTPYIPYPLSSGGAVSQFEINDCLRNSIDITMVFPVSNANKDDFETLKKKWPNIKFKPYSPSFFDKISHFFVKFFHYGWLSRILVTFQYISTKNENDKNILRHSTIYQTISIDPGIPKFVSKLIDSTHFDFVQVEFSAYMSLGKYLPSSLPKVFIHHELMFARESSELNIVSKKTGILKRLLDRNKLNELHLLSHFDKIVTLSEDDKSKLIPHIPSSKIHVSPFVIRSQSSVQSQYNFDNKLVFIGGEGHLPNKDGLRWFVENCWPALHNLFPSLTLHVIGHWTPEKLSWTQQQPNIRFLGFVDNLGDACYGSISIVPIRIGSGIRMKIIETINIGIPFVTTSIGVEGLNFEDGRECYIADTPEAFIEAIREIIEQPNVGQELVDGASLVLREQYSYERIVQKRLETYDIEVKLNNLQ